MNVSGTQDQTKEFNMTVKPILLLSFLMINFEMNPFISSVHLYHCHQIPTKLSLSVIDTPMSHHIDGISSVIKGSFGTLFVQELYSSLCYDLCTLPFRDGNGQRDSFPRLYAPFHFRFHTVGQRAFFFL